MDSGTKCFIANIAVLLAGITTTMLLLVRYLSWPWWAYLLLFPVVFVFWHLLVERGLSYFVNRLIEGPPRKPSSKE